MFYFSTASKQRHSALTRLGQKLGPAGALVPCCLALPEATTGTFRRIRVVFCVSPALLLLSLRTLNNASPQGLVRGREACHCQGGGPASLRRCNADSKWYAFNASGTMYAEVDVAPYPGEPVCQELCLRIQFRQSLGHLCRHHDQRHWPLDLIGLSTPIQGVAVLSTGGSIRSTPA